MVNVYPNPLYGYNELSSYYTNTPDEPYVTFTNLPEQITVKIYSLSGSLLRTLTTDDKASPTSPFLELGSFKSVWFKSCIGNVSGYSFVTNLW